VNWLIKPFSMAALGMLLIVVALVGVMAPLAAIAIVQLSRFRTSD
jgi:hypothetical protein